MEVYAAKMYLVRGSSFPSFTWERFLYPRNFISRRLLLIDGLGSAMKWPPQVRSQVKLGNEEQTYLWLT